ncbi:MAG TPA: phosphopantetheine-binding protein [Planctomycetota bacterium]|nr:phosphopantetheine-binding protein [Planctomycetota bacterium]
MTPKQDLALDVISKISSRERATLTPQQELTADLGIDSPKGLQLLMELEEKLQLEISDEEAARMATVGDVLNFVANK